MNSDKYLFIGGGVRKLKPENKEKHSLCPENEINGNKFISVVFPPLILEEENNCLFQLISF